MAKKLLTFVGRTPEVTMQTQLTAAVKKAPGNPFVRVKPGVFGLLRYPEMTRRGAGGRARRDRRTARRSDAERRAPERGRRAERADAVARADARRERRRGRDR